MKWNEDQTIRVQIMIHQQMRLIQHMAVLTAELTDIIYILIKTAFETAQITRDACNWNILEIDNIF